MTDNLTKQNATQTEATFEPIDLAAIRKRVEDSEGPWEMYSDDVDTFAVETEYQEIGGLNHSCALFLANAHSDMDALLREIERLTGELQYVNGAWVKEVTEQQAAIVRLTANMRHLQVCSGTCEDEMRIWKCRNEAHTR